MSEVKHKKSHRRKAHQGEEGGNDEAGVQPQQPLSPPSSIAGEEEDVETDIELSLIKKGGNGSTQATTTTTGSGGGGNHSDSNSDNDNPGKVLVHQESKKKVSKKQAKKDKKKKKKKGEGNGDDDNNNNSSSSSSSDDDDDGKAPRDTKKEVAPSAPPPPLPVDAKEQIEYVSKSLNDRQDAFDRIKERNKSLEPKEKKKGALLYDPPKVSSMEIDYDQDAGNSNKKYYETSHCIFCCFKCC